MTKQKIICRNSKCYEPDSIDNELDALYDKKNIIKDIEKELLKEMM